MSALRRTAVGAFDVGRAVALEAVGPSVLLPPAAAVSFLEPVALGGAALDGARHGRKLSREDADAPGEGPWAILDEDGALVAVYERSGPDELRAAVVVDPR